MLGQVIFQADGEKGLGTTGLAFCRATVGLIIGATLLLFVDYFVKELANARGRKQQTMEGSGVGSAGNSASNSSGDGISGDSDGGNDAAYKPRNTFSNPNPMHVQQHSTHVARSTHMKRFHDSTSDVAADKITGEQHL